MKLKLILTGIKNSYFKNKFLNILIFISIVLCCAVFIWYNSTFFDQKRAYFSSGLDMHSVEFVFEQSENYNVSEDIYNVLSSDICEFIVLQHNLPKMDYSYTINNINTLIKVGADPYNGIYSTTTHEKIKSEPEQGHAYLSYIFSINSNGRGLFTGGSFKLDNMEYVFDSVLAFTKYDMVVSLEDFKSYDSIDGFTYSFFENTSLKKINQINERLLEMFPGADITLNKGLSEEDKVEYNQNLIILSILMFACIINYNFIFLYLIKSRMNDFAIMRLFGMKRHHAFFMINLELIFYNVIAYITTLIGFLLYWYIKSDTVSLLLKINDTIIVVCALLIFNLICGIISTTKFTLKLPISYKSL